MAALAAFLSIAVIVLAVYAVCERSRSQYLLERWRQEQAECWRQVAERDRWTARYRDVCVERDALRSKLADVIDEAGKASATDGGWLAKLLQRWAA